MEPISAIRRFRIAVGVFIFGLVVSGLTAFPLLHEIKLVTQMLGLSETPSTFVGPAWERWVLTIRFGLEDTYRQYPWIAYGTDWLAFGHLVIAVFFVGPLVEPRGSRWILISGVVACVAVIPLALICGPIRGIPFYWRLIDCSFGVLGLIPLLYCLRLLRTIDTSEGARP